MNSQIANVSFTNFVNANAKPIGIGSSVVEMETAPTVEILRKAEQARQTECRKHDDRVFEYWSIGMIALTVISTVASMIKMVM